MACINNAEGGEKTSLLEVGFMSIWTPGLIWITPSRIEQQTQSHKHQEDFADTGAENKQSYSLQAQTKNLEFQTDALKSLQFAKLEYWKSIHSTTLKHFVSLESNSRDLKTNKFFSNGWMTFPFQQSQLEVESRRTREKRGQASEQIIWARNSATNNSLSAERYTPHLKRKNKIEMKFAT